MKEQLEFADVSEEYAAFVEKFKPKKTTDDCYTPENIYNAVATWASNKYGFDQENIIRPFWPGADYQRMEYPQDCIVLDNPPFSILAKIVYFYMEHGIRFFLFAPSLTLFVTARTPGIRFIASGSSITYANGANVNTSFVTNLGETDIIAESEPDLKKIIERINKENQKEQKKQTRKLKYPDSVLTAAKLQYFSHHGIKFYVRRSEAIFIRSLDNDTKGIFGGAFLLSERAAAERAAAERV